MASTRANIISKGYTGNTVIPANRNRQYLLIQVIGTLNVSVGESATGSLLVTDYWEPYVAPTGELTITTTDSFVVLEG